MKKIALICSVIFVLLGCSDKSTNTDKPEKIITTGHLEKLGFIRAKYHPNYKLFSDSNGGYLKIAGNTIFGDYVIEGVRAGDMARELGFEISDVYIPAGQPLGSTIRWITIPNWHIEMCDPIKKMSEKKGWYGKNPDDICIVAMTQITQSRRELLRSMAPPRYIILTDK